MRPSIIRILAPLSLGLLSPLTGCDAEDDTLSFRTDEAPLFVLHDLHDPVPGGGGCEGCVTCFGRDEGGASGHMCVINSHFTGSSISPNDDQALWLGSPLQWQLYAKAAGHLAKEAELCSGGACTGEDFEHIIAGHVQVKIPSLYPGQSLPTQLRFTQIGGLTWAPNDGPRVEIREDIAATHSADVILEGSAAPLINKADSITKALAHITYSAEKGAGVKSCSGFLIADHLILTAAHCFGPPGNVEPSLENWPVSLPVPDDLQVRIGGLHSPDQPSFQGDKIYKAVAIHIHPDMGIDLAVLRIKGSTCVRPLPLAGKSGAWKNGAKPKFAAYGYGVSGIPGQGSYHYDWGRLKQTSLNAETSVHEQFAEQEKLITFAHPVGKIGVCHGDSGGPVIRTSGTTSQVVGVMLARVVGEEDTPLAKSNVELLSGRGFAFSRHNACGLASPLAYVAARLDREEVHDWIDELKSVQTPPLNCPSEQHGLPMDPPAPAY